MSGSPPTTKATVCGSPQEPVCRSPPITRASVWEPTHHKSHNVWEPTHHKSQCVGAHPQEPQCVGAHPPQEPQCVGAPHHNSQCVGAHPPQEPVCGSPPTTRASVWEPTHHKSHSAWEASQPDTNSTDQGFPPRSSTRSQDSSVAECYSPDQKVTVHFPAGECSCPWSPFCAVSYFHPILPQLPVKRSRPFCQKWRWQDTAKHTCTYRCGPA